MECNVDNLDEAPLPIRTGTEMFTTRSHDIFSSLGELEKKHSAFLKVLSSKGSMEDQGLVKLDPDEKNPGESNVPALSSHRRKRQDLGDTTDADFCMVSRNSKKSNVAEKRQNDFHGSQCPSFKRPQSRPFHKRVKNQVPDFKKYPEKYTHYSLGDVSENDMSERSNSKAAFAFLEERRLQREKAKEEDVVFDTELAACSQGQIAFSRPNHKKNTDNEQHDKADQTQFVNASSSLTFSFDDSDILQEEGLKSRSADTENPSDISNTKLDEGKSPVSSFKSRKNNLNKRNHIRKKYHDNDSD